MLDARTFLTLLFLSFISVSCAVDSLEQTVQPSDKDRFSEDETTGEDEATAPNSPSSLSLNGDYVTGNSPADSPSISWTNPSGDYANIQVALGTSQGATNFVFWTNISEGLSSYIYADKSFTECQSYYPSIRSISEEKIPSDTISTGSSFYWDNTSPSLSGNLYISNFSASSTSAVTVSLSSLVASDNCNLNSFQFAIGYDDDADGFDSGDRENIQSFFTASGGSSLSSYRPINGTDGASFSLITDRTYYISVKVIDNVSLESSVISSNGWRVNDSDLSSEINAKVVWGDGSGGGGAVIDGGDGTSNAGGDGAGGNDSLVGTSYADVIFGDGSGGGGGSGFSGGDVGGNGGSAGGGDDFIIAGSGDDIIFADGFVGDTGGSDKNSAGGDGGYGGGGAGGSSPIPDSSQRALGGIYAGDGGGADGGIETDVPSDAQAAQYGGGEAGVTPAQSFGSGGGGVSLDADSSSEEADGDGADQSNIAENGNTEIISTDLSSTDYTNTFLADVLAGSGNRIFNQAMGSGNDIIIPGNGTDYIFLGNGNDTIIYNDSNDGNDYIYNFSAGASEDSIILRNLLVDYVAGVSDLTDYISVTNPSSDTLITVDIDGAGSGTTTITIRLINISSDYSTLVNNNLTID